MDNSIYEVTRDEYVGFLDQIKPDARMVKNDESLEEYKIIKTYSIKTGKLWCTRIIPKSDEETEHFYVFEMPDDDERQAPRIKRKVVLKTKEEVQNFFNALNNAMKEKEAK